MDCKLVLLLSKVALHLVYFGRSSLYFATFATDLLLQASQSLAQTLYLCILYLSMLTELQQLGLVSVLLGFQLLNLQEPALVLHAPASDPFLCCVDFSSVMSIVDDLNLPFLASDVGCVHRPAVTSASRLCCLYPEMKVPQWTMLLLGRGGVSDLLSALIPRL